MWSIERSTSSLNSGFSGRSDNESVTDKQTPVRMRTNVEVRFHVCLSTKPVIWLEDLDLINRLRSATRCSEQWRKVSIGHHNHGKVARVDKFRRGLTDWLNDVVYTFGILSAFSCHLGWVSSFPSSSSGNWPEFHARVHSWTISFSLEPAPESMLRLLPLWQFALEKQYSSKLK